MRCASATGSVQLVCKAGERYKRYAPAARAPSRSHAAPQHGDGRSPGNGAPAQSPGPPDRVDTDPRVVIVRAHVHRGARPEGPCGYDRRLRCAAVPAPAATLLGGGAGASATFGIQRVSRRRRLPRPRHRVRERPRRVRIVGVEGTKGRRARRSADHGPTDPSTKPALL